MADLPQIPIVTITRFHNDNFMDQSSCLPVTTLMYDLTVPSNIEVRQEHDAVVHGLLEASSAGPYIYKAAPKKTGPAPFSISDTIVLSAGNKRQRDAILQSVVRLWGQAIGQGSKDIKIQVMTPKSEVSTNTESSVFHSQTSYWSSPLIRPRKPVVPACRTAAG